MQEPHRAHRGAPTCEEPVCAWGEKVWSALPAVMQAQVKMVCEAEQ